MKRYRAFTSIDTQSSMVGGIFVSYRRIDSRLYAGRLYDRLTNHFGRKRVFMDIEGSIPRGVDFSKQLDQALHSAAAVVVVIGPQWLTCTDSSGRPRLENSDDWVRHEIDVAIKRGHLLLPVVVDGASLPTAEELPEELRSLTRRQASEITDTRWDYDVGEVIKALERVVPVRPTYWWLKWLIAAIVALAALLTVISGILKTPDNVNRSVNNGSHIQQSASPTPSKQSIDGLPDRITSNDTIDRVAFSPNGRFMAYSSSRNVTIWDLVVGGPIRSLTVETPQYGDSIKIAFSPDSSWLAAGGYESDIKVYKTDTWELSKTLPGHRSKTRVGNSITTLVFSPDGRFLASGSIDTSVKLWEFPRGKLLKTFIGHSGYVHSISFSKDGQRIASGASDGLIKIWNTLTEPKLIKTISAATNDAVAVVFSPDGRFFAWTSDHGVITIGDAETYQPLKALRNHPRGTTGFGAGGPVKGFVFSTDSRRLISMYYYAVAVWDIASGEILKTETRHTSFVYTVALSPDNSVIASGGQDNTLLFLRIP